MRDIHEYISRDNPSAAARVVKSIYDKVQILRDLPEIGYRYRTEEEDEKHLALLIHQAGEDARIRRKILDEHFKKLNDMIAEAVLSQQKSLPS